MLIISCVMGIVTGGSNPSSNYTGTEVSANLNSANAMSVMVKAKWIDVCASGTTKALVSLSTNGVKNYDYSGAGQCAVLTKAGYYKLEVWGAQGGSSSRSGSSAAFGGYGAYAVGVVSAAYNTPLYVYVGGSGKLTSDVTHNGGGYNGGGESGLTQLSGTYITTEGMGVGSGGGATHIAKRSGLLSSLSAYKGSLVGDTHYNSSDILIVGSGGGGANDTTEGINSGSHGGGITGNEATTTYGGCRGQGSHCNGYPGTQTSGGTIGWHSYASDSLTSGSFGQGGGSSTYPGAGGGGGFFGAGGSLWYSGSGGSSYIGSSNLISGVGITKHMTCYSCTTSTAASTYTISNTNVSATATADYSKIGNGYARITYLGTSI